MINITVGNKVLPVMSRDDKGRSLLEALSDYVVIDLETTGLDPRWDNIIELAAVRVENDIITNRFQSLVNPTCEIDEFITELTGITNEMLVAAPLLQDVLPAFINFTSNSVVVAHNANFDVNFLYDNCLLYLQVAFVNDFVDTMRVSRRMFKEHKRHTLSAIVERFGLSANVEHRALSDALLTFECYEYMKRYAFDNNITFQSLYPKKSKRSNKHSAKSIQVTVANIDNNSLMYNKSFVFTGALEKMTRREAMQIVVNVGGICTDSVTKNTNYLVLGNNDYCSTIKDGKSRKQKKAEQLLLSGSDIETISENVFYDMFGVDFV